MPHYNRFTLDEYASLLTRTFSPQFPRDNRPRAVTDTTEKGEEVLEFILPHPTDGRFSVSLTVGTAHGYVTDCTLWFGQAEVASSLAPEDAPAAVTEVIEDRIVALVRYKNRDAYDNRRKAPTSSEWLYQMPDDEDELNRMLEKLRKPASFFEKLSGNRTGVFELYRWSSCEILTR